MKISIIEKKTKEINFAPFWLGFVETLTTETLFFKIKTQLMKLE